MNHCLEELREQITLLNKDHLLDSLILKLRNLEECIGTDHDEFGGPDDDETTIKLAILGSMHSGLSQLVERFVVGDVPNPDEIDRKTYRKSALQLMTGSKAPLYVAQGNRIKTQAPIEGVNRSLVLWKSTDDLNPQVIAWAHAYLLVFSCSDLRTLKSCSVYYSKICRYGSSPPLVFAVGVQGLEGSDSISLEQATEEIKKLDSKISVAIANPYTGMNVDHFFHDILHVVADIVHQKFGADRIGTVMTPIKRSKADKDARLSQTGLGRSIPRKQGMLLKYGAKANSMSSQKRWVVVGGGKLVYYHTMQDYVHDNTGKEINLARVTIKSNLRDRVKDKEKEKAVFSLVDMKNRSWTFEAASSTEGSQWIGAIEDEILDCLTRETSGGLKNTLLLDKSRYTGLSPAQLEALYAVEGNTLCADCSCSMPEWASLNLGILICIDCSGVHRNLGVQVSRVRSFLLDDWRNDHFDIMVSIGNRAANNVWENDQICISEKPNPNSSSNVRSLYIRKKYLEKAFLAPISSALSLGQMLLEAVQTQTIAQGLSVLIRCGKVEINMLHEPQMRAVLHVATEIASVPWTQMIIWYNCDVNLVDGEGHTALYIARKLNNDLLMEILCTAGCTSFGIADESPSRIMMPVLSDTEEYTSEAEDAAPPSASPAETLIDHPRPVPRPRILFGSGLAAPLTSHSPLVPVEARSPAHSRHATNAEPKLTLTLESLPNSVV